MNKSLGLLKSLMNKNYMSRHQTMEINRSNRYSPTKKPKKQKCSINKLNQANFNSNIEKKKNIYQQSLQKIDKNNKFKSNQNKKSLDINHFYKNNILNGNNTQNNFKNQNNSKTINNSKNKNYNTSLQKKIGSKSYVDLFQNNIYNSNDQINLGAGRTISSSIYEKLYDFENNMNNNTNNYDNEHSSFVLEMNNIINVLINYINIIKEEYEKIIIKKVQNKDKEIKNLQNEKEFLIKENKKLKYKIIEIFYFAKKYENDKDLNKSKNSFCIKQLINENKYLRNCLNKTNNINKTYYIQLENDIHNHFLQKELSIQKKIEEEKNEQNINNNKENEQNNDNNPFKYINNNNNTNNIISKVNHKRQKTQFKIGLSVNNENNNKMKEDEKLKNNGDILGEYINKMNNNNILMSKNKNSSQKNLLMNKNNNNSNIKIEGSTNEENNNINSQNGNNNLSMSSDNDSVVHNKDNTYNGQNVDEEKESSFKKIQELNYFPTDEKYNVRIEFTK